MTEGDGFKIKLRQGSGLTLTHPAGSTAGHLGVHTDIERHLTKCRDPALTKSPDNGLRTQVINKVLCVFLKCNSVIEFTVTEVNHTTTETALPGIPEPDMTLEGNTCTATDTTLFTLQNIHPPGVQSFDSAR
ncbi:Uncharacterised protein [Escherichia coli]|nr:Uncharacterised protein [Escherichia coli]